ncbi:MAG: outer membrane protein assembly factor BamC, partial [Gammaproteobacteria bacterium]|nr:outer membrane protein assembly factor BamC [Gammaproteobacteria bacterium]
MAEPEGMVLKYKLDFDRAWATVGAALEDARISVEDLDRTSAIYYVYYSSRHDPDPGFFSK